MSIHHLSLASESASPFSKCFPWALSHMDTLNKPNGFWKHLIWPLRASEDYYEIHGKIRMSCVSKRCDWAGRLNFEVLRGLFTEQSVERGGLMLIVTLQIYVTQLMVGYYWTVLHLVFWFLFFQFRSKLFHLCSYMHITDWCCFQIWFPSPFPHIFMSTNPSKCSPPPPLRLAIYVSH